MPRQQPPAQDSFGRFRTRTSRSTRLESPEPASPSSPSSPNSPPLPPLPDSSTPEPLSPQISFWPNHFQHVLAPATTPLNTGVPVSELVTNIANAFTWPEAIQIAPFSQPGTSGDLPTTPTRTAPPRCNLRFVTPEDDPFESNAPQTTAATRPC
jgi:hypothetical protein